MAGHRRARILDLLVGDGDRPLEGPRICEVGAQITGMTGAGIMLMAADVAHGSLCTSDKVSAVLEDLQYMLGEGPCIDACQDDRPALEPDLANPAAPRWIAFSTPAVEAGARAVFGFPLRVGAVGLGALNLYRDRPGPLTDEQHADALVMADMAAQSILVLQAKAPPGTLAVELEAGAELHHVVHQASGMVAVQLGVGVGLALVRLRAHAFASGASLTDVARQVVGRTLRLDGHDLLEGEP